MYGRFRRGGFIFYICFVFPFLFLSPISLFVACASRWARWTPDPSFLGSSPEGNTNPTPPPPPLVVRASRWRGGHQVHTLGSTPADNITHTHTTPKHTHTLDTLVYWLHALRSMQGSGGFESLACLLCRLLWLLTHSPPKTSKKPN